MPTMSPKSSATYVKNSAITARNLVSLSSRSSTYLLSAAVKNKHTHKLHIWQTSLQLREQVMVTRAARYLQVPLPNWNGIKQDLLYGMYKTMSSVSKQIADAMVHKNREGCKKYMQ